MPNISQPSFITNEAQIVDGVIVNADINASAAIEASKLQELSLGVNAGVIPTPGIVNAHVAATAALALSKLAAGTHGNVLFYNSAGVLTVLAVGTAGTFLTTNGAGADPTWTGGTAPVWFPLYTETGANANIGDEIAGVSLPDSASTQAFGSLFMPSDTIASIQLVAQADASVSGNVVLDFDFAGLSDGAAATVDSTDLNVIGDFASNVLYQFVDVPAASYNGLTQGMPWAVRVRRVGANGSDTLGATLQAVGMIVNFS